MNGKFLLARDTVNGAEGKIFVTIGGRNIEIASMRNIQTDAEIQSSDMRVIGTRMVQTKVNGVKGSGSGNIYYGSDIFRDMLLEYMNTGKMQEFDIQITNDDPSTSIGRQSMAFYGCVLTGTIPMAILNDEEAMLNYDFNFAYTRASKIEAFSEPASYGS